MKNSLTRINSANRRFWIEQPALLLAISLLIGTSSYLFWEAPWKWIFPFLWCLYLIFLRSWAPIFLLLGGSLYSWCLYSSPPASTESAYFSISSLKPHQTPFHKGLIYRGDLRIENTQVPCSVYYRGLNHPMADCDYLLAGNLIQRGPYEYIYKPHKWIPIEKTWSLAELRYQMKERLRIFLEQKLHRPRTASFLGSLITGDVEDRTLRFEFGRLGLQHILAISGFHFGILIAFCSFFLGLFVSKRWKLVILLLAVNIYFIFVGTLPAVQRSWLTAELYLLGKLMGRHSTGLNLLGMALLVEVILDPLVSTQIGFQLSFLSCAGILLFHSHFEKKLRFLLPKRKSLTEYSLVSRHGYLLSAFIRHSLSLSLAVNLALLPLLLFHFHKFPYLSLLYNLFFPLFVGAALFSLLVSLIVHLFLPPLSFLCFNTTDFLTAQLLELASYPPLALDYSLTIQNISSWMIPFYLFGLFFLSLSLLKKKSFD